MNNGLRIIALASMTTYLGLAIQACSKSPAPPPPPVQDTGRADTRSLSNVDAIGYNGTAIRQKLDKTLNANDNRTNQLDHAEDQQTQQQPDQQSTQP